MRTITTLLSLVAAGSAALLTSCVDPYYAGLSSTTVTVHRPGYVVQTLPHGYRTEVIGGTNYYYHDNVYYRPQGRGYVVVDAPRGGPRHDDRDHRHDRDRDRDRGRDRDWDRGPGRGPGRDVTVIRELPRGYKVVTHGGKRYYRAGDVYYQSQGSGYVIVRNPY
ncbi:DUF6515 family protein [Luteolibacter luteus]|uniref:Uncharacterized protein n=1 Tax=Luteolibacter luteus TaxID=2728835 RepID=A0A858RJL6_9BACT|nr:DUF6515 family protein [Luteolibacter luteus]QJE96704.1 hypothetical protein HHL09_13235 [Luteolibacter luteus]